MEIQEIQAKQQAELHTQLWAMANDLRGNMDASEFKNYILGLIFYRYLSDKLLRFVNSELKEDEITYEEAWNDEDFKDDIIELLTDSEGGLGYVIEPNNLWSTLIDKINVKQFDISMLAKAVNDLTESTLGLGSQRDFENLFDDMDLNASKLGKTEADRSALISKVMLKINDINFHYEDAEIDVLGDAYEYLIGQFAASAGKKAGEFYTPQQISKLLAKLVTIGKTKLKNVYDPTCGSGSLLLRVAKEAEVVSFYGQEKVSTTYNLARMNMLLHGVPFNHFDIENNDTLEHPNEKHMQLTFEAVVANPPYSAKWSADSKFLDEERFSGYGKLAPKSKADYAFIQHMLYLLDDAGTMAVVLPHGVLFRGAAEGVIRKYLIEEKNWLDAVIGLPANLFFGTSIPTCILVFRKCKTHDDIFFIDASKEFESGKNQNRLTDANIEKILNTYIERKGVEKYAHCASLEEIKENDYNLNIPRYVDTFEEEEEIDIHAVMKEIKELEAKRDELDEEIAVYLKELGLMED